MRLLFIHPSVLPYSEIFLRLEALGLERVAAARAAGHEVPILDPQVFGHADLDHELAMFRPEAVGFGLNYLANVPEVIDLAHRVKQRHPAASSSPEATLCPSSPHTCSSRRRTPSTRSCGARENQLSGRYWRRRPIAPPTRSRASSPATSAGRRATSSRCRITTTCVYASDAS